MQTFAFINRRSMKAGLPAILLLALSASGCVVDAVQPRTITINEADGTLWVPTDTAARLQCDDGLLLVCSTGSGRLSNRECRCLR
jgi:hypothetical protein